jgi:very-short-patch-repair endonuclease
MAIGTNISQTTPASGERVARQRVTGERQRAHLVKVLGVVDLLSVSGSRDQRIATVAERQRGRVSRRQLLSAGISDGQIHRLLATGALHRLFDGVYAVGHLAPIELGRETAALLTCRDGSLLSHATAAAMWKLGAAGEEAPVDITVFGGSPGRRPGIHFHRTRILAPHDISVVHGLPVTSPARTLLDLAERATHRELERALDEGLMNRILTRAQITGVLARATGRRGAVLLADVLSQRTGATMTRSEAEELMLAHLRAAQLPDPEVNGRIHGFQVDFLWRQPRLVVEVDGFKFHGSRRAFERDRAKSARLSAAGMQVLRFTWMQLEFESYAVIVRIAQALAWAEARRSA